MKFNVELYTLAMTFIPRFDLTNQIILKDRKISGLERKIKALERENARIKTEMDFFTGQIPLTKFIDDNRNLV